MRAIPGVCCASPDCGDLTIGSVLLTFVNNHQGEVVHEVVQYGPLNSEILSLEGPNERDQNMSCFEGLEMGLNLEVLRPEVDAL